MARTQSAAHAVRALREMYRAGGYVRRPNRARQEREGPDAYKKGYEVRLVLPSHEAVRAARQALEDVGLRPGKPFRKHGRFVQPVYGRAAVELIVGPA